MSTTTQEEAILAFAESQWGVKSLERIALKLAEETGEIAGAIIKSGEGRCEADQIDLEIGDALIVLSQLAAKRGHTLNELRAKRFAAIQARAAAPMQFIGSKKKLSPRRHSKLVKLLAPN